MYKLVSYILVIIVGAFSMFADNTKTYDVTVFDKVSFDGTGTLHLTQGEQISVKASGQSSLIQSLAVEVSDGVLHVEVAGDSGAVDDIHVYITVNTLTEVSSNGRGKVLMNEFAVENLHLRGIGRGEFLLASLHARELSVESRGASRFEISGTADRQVIDLGGAGEYLAQNLITSVVSINIFGAGIGELWANEWLDIRITGAGRISFCGAAQVAQKVFGFGSVQRLDKL